MPRYFFNIRTGNDVLKDPDGELCPDLGAARVEAIAAIRELLAWLVQDGKVVDGQILEICDENDIVLDAIKFRDTFNMGE